MRHLGQVEVGAQLGEVLQQGDDAAVVGLQRQDGEQLGLREVLAASAARVRRERLAADLQGRPGHAAGRLGHWGSELLHTPFDAPTPPRDSTEQVDV